MSREDEIKDLLIEIRDNRRLSLRHQEEHLEIARQLAQRSNKQVEESIELQKLAMAKAIQVARIAPAGLVVSALIPSYMGKELVTELRVNFEPRSVDFRFPQSGALS